VAGQRKLQNEELHDLYSSLSIFWVIKWRRIRWEGYVVHMEKRNTYKVCGMKPEGKTS